MNIENKIEDDYLKEYITDEYFKKQRYFFGNRFVGAHLSKIDINEENNSKVANWLLYRKNFMVIMGENGTGKTYLCSAITACMLNIPLEIEVYKESKLFSLIGTDIINCRIDDELLILDNFGYSTYTDLRKEILTEIIHYRYASLKPTIIVVDVNREQFEEKYGKRLANYIFSIENTIIDMTGCGNYRE